MPSIKDRTCCLTSSAFRSLEFPLIILASALLVLPSNAQLGNGMPMLQPSRTLFPSFGRQEPDTMYRSHETELLQADWLQEKSCHFVATTGKLFNQSVTHELKSIYSKDIMDGDTVKVYVPDEHISDWIYFTESSNSLVGVPLLRHTDLLHNVIISLQRHGDVIYTLPCVIEVTIGSSGNRKLNVDSSLETSVLHCAPSEPIVTIAVTLDVNQEQLDPHKRVELIQKFAKYLIPSLNPSAITLSFQDTGRHHAFLSGHGNVAVTPLVTGTTLSWPIACGSDSAELSGLDDIEESSRNGSLAHVLGYDVIQWRAENRKPLVTLHPTNERRFKRRTDREKYRSPVPQYPPATALYPKNALDLAPYDQVADEPQPKENYWAAGLRGRKRIPLSEIKASPVIGFPPATRLPNPDSLARKFPVPPSTPVIIPPLNSPPEKNAGVEDLRVQGSTYFEYAIPIDAFSDRESGDTRSLSLSLIDLFSYDPLDGGEDSDGTNTWLLMDQQSQIIYGVPPRPTPSGKPPSFIIVAADNVGKTTTDTFAVHLVARPRPTNHRFTMVFSNHNTERKSTSLASAFARCLSFALGSRWEAIAAPGHYTILKITKNNEQLTVSWFDNSLGSKTRCDRTGIERTWSKMVSNQLNPSLEIQRSRPKSSFAKKFLPEFTLRSVKLTSIGPCLALPETTTQSTTESTTPPTIPPPPPSPPKTKSTTRKPTTTRMPSPPPITMMPKLTTTTTIRTSRQPVDSTTKTTTTTLLHQPESFLPTTIKSTTTSKRFPVVPQVVDPDFTFEISCHIGVICEQDIPDTLYSSQISQGDLRYRLVPWGDGTPQWVAVDRNKNTIVALPTLTDIRTLDQFKSGEVTWKGGLVAIDQSGRPSDRVPVNIKITIPSATTLDENLAVTHLFVMKITNYQLENFTAVESGRLLDALSKLYRNPNTDMLYVHPLQSGSVMFSWHNTSLTQEGHCPYIEIAKLGSELFDSGKLKTSVQNKLLAAGFNIGSLKLERKNACLNVKEAGIPPASTTKATTTTANPADGGDSLQTAGGDGVTSIVIIAVVLVCLLVLVAILVIKFRLSNKAKQKRKEKKRLQSAAATAAIIPPSSPYHLDDKKNHNGSNADTRLLFKPGTPIVFEGEEENGVHGNSPLLHRQTSTFTHSVPNTSPVTNGGQGVITESTPLTPSKGVDQSRPPPPPYVRK